MIAPRGKSIPVSACVCRPGLAASAGCVRARAANGVAGVADFLHVLDLVLTRHLFFASFGKFVAVEHRNQHAGRARYPSKDPLAP